MNAPENSGSQIADAPEHEMLPLSLLNDYLYCPRRAALKVVEGWRSANRHTERGDIVHEHSDLAGYEVVKGVTLLRALPVWSERLGLNGKCDIVEVHPSPQPLTRPQATLSPSDGERAGVRGIGTLLPVEFKLGKRRQWVNDDAQLCAQALCLEEMFRVSIPRGAVFHADSKRRREVEFTPELRQRTADAVAALHALLNSPIPAAVYREACEECSLFHICLPKATAGDSRAKRLADALFKTN
jgi:CRISPR-associated exonuclease Cas4